MFAILYGLSIALILLSVISCITFVLALPQSIGLPSSGVFLIFRVLPVVMLVSFLTGIPLATYTSNPENCFRNCVETVQDKDFCELKYLKIPETKR